MKHRCAFKHFSAVAILCWVGQTSLAQSPAFAPNGVTHYPPVGQNFACNAQTTRTVGRQDLIGQTCAAGYGEYLQRYFHGQWADRCGTGKALTGMHSIRCVDGLNSDKRPRAQFYARGCCVNTAAPGAVPAPHPHVSFQLGVAPPVPSMAWAAPVKAVDTQAPVTQAVDTQAAEADEPMGSCSAPPVVTAQK